MSNLLFICNRNQWRSPTAEQLFRDHPLHDALSAGTSNSARIKVNQGMIDWADVIFFMEWEHRDIVTQRFRLQDQKLIVLEIEDIYPFGDPELIDMLTICLAEYLK
ncbi:MAG TPA: hypothetical protein VHC47_11115 [Mucilaginibacter sp.]|nr:hypothetical protein [Mucilaginibacter sp.]